MESFVSAILPQSPGIAVALILVISGLKYLESAEKRNIAERKDFLNKLDDLGKNCHDLQRETSKSMNEAINRNTDMMGRVGHALDRIKA